MKHQVSRATVGVDFGIFAITEGLGTSFHCALVLVV